MTTQTASAADTITTAPAHLHRLILAGFMGAGKTTVGRLLAARLGWEFLDLDAYLEARAGQTVPEIFAAHGEPRFRQLESNALASALGRSKVILALGGGTPEILTNRLLLEQTPGTATIFLDAPFPTLYDRCLLQALNPGTHRASPARRSRRRRETLQRPSPHLPQARPPHRRHSRPDHRADCLVSSCRSPHGRRQNRAPGEIRSRPTTRLGCRTLLAGPFGISRRRSLPWQS